MFFDLYLQEGKTWARSGAFTQHLEPGCVNAVQKCSEFHPGLMPMLPTSCALRQCSAWTRHGGFWSPDPPHMINIGPHSE